MKIIMRYEINGKLYNIVEDDGHYKVVSSLDNDIELDELVTAKNIVSNLLPTKNLRQISKVLVKNKAYDLFYNHDKDLYWFNAEGEDLSYLNNIFNHRPGEVYRNSIKKDNAFFRRVVKLGAAAVVVLVSSSFMLGLNTDIVNDIDKQIEGKRAVNYHDIFNTDEIGSYVDNLKFVNNSNVEAEIFPIISEHVNNNGMLSRDEKNEILSVPFLFEDNKEYLDMDEVLCHLDNLLVIYDNTENNELNASFNHTRFDSGSRMCDGYIKVYGAYGVYSDLASFQHELCHVIQSGFDTDLNYNYMLVEATNTMFTSEYFGSGNNVYDYDNNAYFDEVKLTKALAEIIGSEALKKYHAYIDEDIIKQELLKIIPNEDMAQSFLTMMNTYGLYVSNVEEWQDFIVTSIREDIVSTLAIYYEEKYQRSMNDDLIMLYYTNYEDFFYKVVDLYDMSGIELVSDKCYINSRLKVRNDALVFTDGEKIIKINDNSRYLDRGMTR